MKTKIIYYASIVLLVQSCVVYKSTPSPLHQVVNQGKVKINYQNHNWDEFDNVIFQNNEYYTVKKQKVKTDKGIYEWIDVFSKLDSTEVSSVLIKDIKKSKNRTIILLASAIPTGAAVLYITVLGFMLRNGF